MFLIGVAAPAPRVPQYNTYSEDHFGTSNEGQQEDHFGTSNEGQPKDHFGIEGVVDDGQD